MSRLSSETLRPDEAATDKQGTTQRPSAASRESGRTKQSMAGQPCCNVRRGFPRVQVQTTQPRTSRVPQRPSLSPRDSRASRVLYYKPVHAVTDAMDLVHIQTNQPQKTKLRRLRLTPLRVKPRIPTSPSAVPCSPRYLASQPHAPCTSGTMSNAVWPRLWPNRFAYLSTHFGHGPTRSVW